MNKPNKYITIIFIFTICYLIYGYISNEKTKVKNIKKSNILNKMPTQTEVIENLPRVTSPSNNFSEKSDALEEKHNSLVWGKNPFLFPEGIDIYKKINKESNKNIETATNNNNGLSDNNKVVEEAQNRSEIKVNSILISGKQKVAAINCSPYVVSIGDWIEDDEVLEITSDYIILGRAGAERKLCLNYYPLSNIDEKNEK